MDYWQLAAGMGTKADIQLYARPVPPGHSEVTYTQELLFVTDLGQCAMTVNATILTEDEFERRKRSKTGSTSRGKAVRLLSTRPPKSKSLA